MSSDLTGYTNVVMKLNNKKDLDLDSVLDSLDINSGVTWTYGTAANKANVLFHDTRTLADGANETLDLHASGTLKDAFGDDLTLDAVKLLYAKNNSADATLKLFGGASNDIGVCADTSDIVLVPPGGIFLYIDPSAAGLDVTTNKNLKIEHDGTGSSTMDVDVVILGLD